MTSMGMRLDLLARETKELGEEVMKNTVAIEVLERIVVKKYKLTEEDDLEMLRELTMFDSLRKVLDELNLAIYMEQASNKELLAYCETLGSNPKDLVTSFIVNQFKEGNFND